LQIGGGLAAKTAAGWADNLAGNKAAPDLVWNVIFWSFSGRFFAVSLLRPRFTNLFFIRYF